MPRILKEEVTGKGGFEASFYRWKPGPDQEGKGGIEIFMRSNDLEEYFRIRSGGQTRDFVGPGIVSGPRVYAVPGREFLDGWGGRDGILHEGTYFSPYFSFNSTLFNGADREGAPDKFNGVFLCAAGLAQGVTIRLEGLYALPDLQKYGELIKTMVNRIYTRCFKPMEMSVEVTRDVA